MRVRDTVTLLSALAAVAVAVLAVGGVLRWSQAIVALLAGIAIASTAGSQRRLSRVSPLVALLGIGTGLTFLQLIPLPTAVIASLSPTMEALRTDGADLVGIRPWPSLTGDVAATLCAAVMLLTLLALALVALRLATSEPGRYRIIVGVAALCGLVACITALHKLFDLDALYGVYQPDYARPRLLGPILNSNSLACLTAVGTVLSIGLAAHRRQVGWLRALWLVNVIACGAITVGTVSRGATLALVGGTIVTLGILVAQRLVSSERSRRRRARFLSGALPMAILAGCLVVLVIYSNAGNVERQLSLTSLEEVHYSRSKFAAWKSALDLIEESPWLGVGRGAFEPNFTRIHQASGLATYAYLENEYLQAAVDWGVPGTILLGLAALWLAYTAARRWRDGAPSAGALGAMAIVAMQSNVDFGLQFLGLAAPVTTIAATLAYVSLREPPHARRFRALRVFHAIGLAVGAFLLLTTLTTTLDEDRQDLARGATLARARESIARHPLDYYGYAIGADVLHRRGDPRAIRLLNHAMVLHPTHPHLHRMAARMLLAQGLAGQAAIEYAASLRATPQPRPLVAEIVGRVPNEHITAALPVDYPYPDLLVRTLNELGLDDIARRWLARVLEINPKASRSCDLLFQLALRGDRAAAEVAGHRCADRLPDYQTRLDLARLLIGKQAYAEAIPLLQDVESWESRRENKIDAWLALCDAHLALGYVDESKRCLRRLDASPDMLAARRGEILVRLEGIHARSAVGRAPLSAPRP